ncbi:molybdopterin biosynthesis sulfur carrier protein [Syntrophotalea carbinolica DSM 2380]|uniref:Molybdopterin biosynthesis sulfur carrier protein n=1 Tax=Syntrophotalea carbinolica (strain DSM 2380 / NBRC 103641 / GraBd1) TaxID=338963 RepID=Q3A3U3_SYNC1|nr:MoaD/ThiS family protein [Syntrophotalea carbinolica]ABA88964.1 molybdopterin biosynthesis sulfur carrier protein [Syntrophotalea carbinolica DSM 2380]
MKVCVKLFATFRNGRFKEKLCEYEAGTMVSQVIKELDLPEDQLGAVLINARHVEGDQELKDGDSLSIFPLVGGG